MLDTKKLLDIKKKVDFKNDYDEALALPNELFGQLFALVKEKKLKSTHLGFTYGYIYLQTYLYRYAKYQSYVPTTGEIKEILGYSKNNKQLDYIIKRNGLLETEGILLSTSDFPIAVQYDEYEKFVISTIKQLDCANEFRESKGVTKNQTCKYPVFGYHRTFESYQNKNSYDGTFYSSEYTHIIEFNAFAFCMANDEIEDNSFFLYAYLKFKKGLHQAAYDATAERLAKETTFSVSSVKRYLDDLRKFDVVTTIHNQKYFVIGWNDREERKASSHSANDFMFFSFQRIAYAKMKAITLEQYNQINSNDSELENLF